MFDVITIGSVTYDDFLIGDFKRIDFTESVSGKAVLFPLGEKLGLSNIISSAGGNAANAAVTFSRQGLKTGAAICLGKDVFGEELEKILKREGISLEFLEIDQNLETARSIIFSSEKERVILGYPGASHKLSLEKLLASEVKAKWLYVSLSGESYKLFSKVVAFGKKIGAKIAFNPTAYHLEKGGQEIKEYLKDIDLLLLNESEASLLTGIDFKKEEEAFKEADRLMSGILAVTYGPDGVMISDNREIYKASISVPEEKIVDRTGAGDAFGSGLVAGLIKEENDLDFAIRLALANGASVIKYWGAEEGILDLQKTSKDYLAKLKITLKKI